jgi:hypothetical protein
VVLVSCLPVATLGLATALIHLLRPDGPEPDAGGCATTAESASAGRYSRRGRCFRPGRPSRWTPVHLPGTNHFRRGTGTPGAGGRAAAPDGRRRPEAAVLAALAAEPEISHAELARRMNCDEATIRRVRKRLAPVTQHD